RPPPPQAVSSRLLFFSSLPHPFLTMGFYPHQSLGNSPLLSFPSDEACNFPGNSCSRISSGRMTDVFVLVLVGTTHVFLWRPYGPNSRLRSMLTLSYHCVRCVHSPLLL